MNQHACTCSSFHWNLPDTEFNYLLMSSSLTAELKQTLAQLSQTRKTTSFLPFSFYIKLHVPSVVNLLCQSRHKCTTDLSMVPYPNCSSLPACTTSESRQNWRQSSLQKQQSQNQYMHSTRGVLPCTDGKE